MTATPPATPATIGTIGRPDAPAPVLDVIRVGCVGVVNAKGVAVGGRVDANELLVKFSGKICVLVVDGSEALDAAEDDVAAALVVEVLDVVGVVVGRVVVLVVVLVVEVRDVVLGVDVDVLVLVLVVVGNAAVTLNVSGITHVENLAKLTVRLHVMGNDLQEDRIKHYKLLSSAP